VLLLPALAAGVSSAGSSRAAAEVRNGRITIINQARGARDPKAGIATIDNRGVLHLLKRCNPGLGSGCYDLQSIDWAPDGRRLAFSVTTIGAISTYNGLHILNIRTRKDRHLPRDGFDIDWSPDGSRFAYVEYARFSDPIGSIYVMRSDGSRRTLVRTGTAGRDASPSWSPDTKRLAYESNTPPEYSALWSDHHVWVVDVDGKHRRILANYATDPAWSPDGRTIAYRTACGIKLITPAGKDVTPPTGHFCTAIGVVGQPVWSPDGRKIAIGNRRGVYVMNRDGSQLSRLTSVNPTGIFRFSRPTWQPLPR
jgi:eukaryotic-like serine/threonine-protein kinase